MKHTHTGMFCGIVPIWLNMTNEEEPEIEVRGTGALKTALELLMDVVEGAFGLYCMACSLLNPNFEPLYPIKITGEARQ